MSDLSAVLLHVLSNGINRLAVLIGQRSVSHVA